MGWLDELAPLTGPRWSAGAVWGGNGLVNGDFSRALDVGWTWINDPSSSTIQHVGPEGDRALQTIGDGSGFEILEADDTFTVTPGVSYRFVVFVWADDVTEVMGHIRWHDAGHGVVGTAAGDATPSAPNTWERIEVALGEAPALTDHIEIRINLENNSTAEVRYAHVMIDTVRDPVPADWGDATEWPIAHDAAAAPSLGVFVAGVDVTDAISAVSWGLGQSDPLAAAVQPSSCSLVLDAVLGAAYSYAPGSRIVVATESDVLWVGVVEGHDIAQVAGTDAPDAVAIAGVDDLARTALDSRVGVPWGGDVMGALSTALLAAGVAGVVYAADEDDATAPAFPTVKGGNDVDGPADHTSSPATPTTHDGTVLALMSGMTYHSVHAGAWTPVGYRVAPLMLRYIAEYATHLEDLDALASISRASSVATIKNEWSISGWGFSPEPIVLEDADSIEAYGARRFAVAGDEWMLAATGISSYWADVFRGGGLIVGDEGDAPTYHEPLVTARMSASVLKGGHTVTRYMPFDQITNGDKTLEGTTERYRVLRVAHRVNVDSWTVELEAVEISMIPA